jgi:hypothetical protein
MEDIVYFAAGKTNEELRYSIRSLCKNFKPFRKLWIIGSKPDDIIPDGFIEMYPDGTKYSNVRTAIFTALNDDRISDNFWLFNDDFFIMKKVKDLPPYYDGSLFEWCGKIIFNNNGFSDYVIKMFDEIRYLKDNNLDVKNFEVHLPMLINKQKALELTKILQDGSKAFRSTYGNMYYSDSAKQHRDVKNIRDYKYKDFLSTSNSTFELCGIGKYIRNKFKDKCKYEQ